MKRIKPGQFVTIGNFVYRAKARTAGCNGCDLNDLRLCPRVKKKSKAEPPIVNCGLDGIILKRL